MQRDVSQQAGLVMASFSMHLFVALGAQSDQVLFHIATRLAPQFEVVHLQVLHAAACLASPAVALQYLSLQLGIARRIESESRASGLDLLQEAFWLISVRKASC
jgi:hypothetical protein